METVPLMIVLASPILATHKLHERFKWSVMEYAFSGEAEKEDAIASGRYIPGNNMPLGVAPWKDKLFVTVPRWKSGVPSTLNFVGLGEESPPSPHLRPYPDWSSTETGNCEGGLTNVHRVRVDSCDRLWVLDTGTVGVGNTTTKLCPVALNVYDLNTDARLRKYQLPLEDLAPNTFIANIQIDEGHSCDDTFAYMSDELGYGIISYSWHLDKSWRFSHSYFRPDPLAYAFRIGGVAFEWTEEGVFSMSLSPPHSDGFRTLFFSPLSSRREFAVSTKVLRDQTKVHHGNHHFLALPERGPDGHVSSQVMNKHGIQFFNLIDINAVGCWNSFHPYHPNFLGVCDKDDVQLIFPSDISVDHADNVWVISNRLPVFLYAALNYADVNFRVLWAPSKVLAHGTPCEGKFDLFGGDKWFGGKF